MNQVPQPEIARQPEVSAFNLDLLSDEQVAVIARALGELAEQANQDDDDDDAVVQVADTVLNVLEADIGNLIDRDVERGRGLLAFLASGQNRFEREMAAYCTPALAVHDYAAASEMLFQLYNDDEISDVAVHAATQLTRRVSPEQAADFDTRLRMHSL